MATEHAMATMEKAANDRMSSALETISDALGITVPPVVPERLDPRMAGIRVIERHAGILELIADALTAPSKEPEGTQEPAKPSQTYALPVDAVEPASKGKGA